MTESLININGENVQTLEVLFLTTIITLLPSILVMMTSFTRYIISFSFLRTALGTQQTPPNIVLIGIALFSHKTARVGKQRIQHRQICRCGISDGHHQFSSGM